VWAARRVVMRLRLGHLIMVRVLTRVMLLMTTMLDISAGRMK
jgi:hypothetical protein